MWYLIFYFGFRASIERLFFLHNTLIGACFFLYAFLAWRLNSRYGSNPSPSLISNQLIYFVWLDESLAVFLARSFSLSLRSSHAKNANFTASEKKKRKEKKPKPSLILILPTAPVHSTQSVKMTRCITYKFK